MNNDLEQLEDNIEKLEVLDITSENNNSDVLEEYDDEKLLKAFIGNNYSKISTNNFSFSGFFFNFYYMYYRKMFLFGFLFYLLAIVLFKIFGNNLIIDLIYCVLVGIFVNKIYLFYAKKKIVKIKKNNHGKALDELMFICSKKGGTGVGSIFIGLLIQIVIATLITTIYSKINSSESFIDMLKPSNWFIHTAEIEDDEDKNSPLYFKDAATIKDVTIGARLCRDSRCEFSIQKDDAIEQFVFKANNIEMFRLFSFYSDFIKVDIYCDKIKGQKVIKYYKVYSKSTYEDITDVTSKEELETKLKLYPKGEYTDTFTLLGVQSSYLKYIDRKFNTVIKYLFKNNGNNQEYVMNYLVPYEESIPDLIIGNTYTISFTAFEDGGIYTIEITKIL